MNTVNDKLSQNTTIGIKRQFVLFLIVGGVNTLFGYTIFALLIFLGLHYIWAVLISTIVGVVFNFFTTGRIVFKNKKYSFFLKFTVLYAFLYIVNICLIALLNLIHHNLYINGGISMVILAGVSFAFNKYYVFKEIT